MNYAPTRPCTAFHGPRRIASGPLQAVVLDVKVVVDSGTVRPVLTFDDATGEVIDLDTRGTTEEVLARLSLPDALEKDAEAPRGRGRPKLGVVAREVTLLPRHWDWLNAQPGGASVALRKLVEEARQVNRGNDRRREAQESVFRFMSAMAGDEPGFEEALRALFAGNHEMFKTAIRAWPADVRDHALHSAAPAFQKGA